MSTSNVQIFASMHHFQEKREKFPEVMADSRARKGQDDLEYLTVRKQQSAQIVISQKDTEARLKDFH